MLAHLHVLSCPCSRCRVAREYARLLATVTPRTEADPSEPVAGETVVVRAESDALHLDLVGHGGSVSP